MNGAATNLMNDPEAASENPAPAARRLRIRARQRRHHRLSGPYYRGLHFIIRGLYFKGGDSGAKAAPPPDSILIGKADTASAPALNFNERNRMSPFDVGAYQT